MNSLTTGPRRVASRVLRPLLAPGRQGLRGGRTSFRALGTIERLKARSMAATLGYWDGPPDSPRGVADNIWKP